MSFPVPERTGTMRDLCNLIGYGEIGSDGRVLVKNDEISE